MKLKNPLELQRINKDGSVVDTLLILDSLSYNSGRTPEFKLEVKQNNPEHIHFWDTDRD